MFYFNFKFFFCKKVFIFMIFLKSTIKIKNPTKTQHGPVTIQKKQINPKNGPRTERNPNTRSKPNQVGCATTGERKRPPRNHHLDL